MSVFKEIVDTIEDLSKFDTMPFNTVEKGLAEALRDRNKNLNKIGTVTQLRLRKVIEAVKREFVERDEAVEAVMASLVAGVSAVFLGPPGTAKSAIVREIACQCGLGPHKQGSGYFEYLLTSHTMPEELFGAPDLKRLTTDSVFQRNIAGMLPTSHLAFLDEVFRGGGHILNTLLSILNERYFHDGVQIHRVPLVGIISASNDPPCDPDLLAFFDRFPVRIWLDSVINNGHLKDNESRLARDLIIASSRHELRRMTNNYNGDVHQNIKVISCMNDIRCAKAVITKELCNESMRLNDAGQHAVHNEEFVTLFRELCKRCDLSDRTLFALKRFAKALQWLTNDKSAHIKAFHFIARSTDERQYVDNAIERAINAGYTGTE